MWSNVKSTLFNRSLTDLIVAMIYGGPMTQPLCAIYTIQTPEYSPTVC